MPKPPSIKSTDNERQREDFDSRAPLAETIPRRLYSYMLKCRTVEERIRLLFRQGRFSGNYFAAVGQEATEVGAMAGMRPAPEIQFADFIAPAMDSIVNRPRNCATAEVSAIIAEEAFDCLVRTANERMKHDIPVPSPAMLERMAL